MVKPAGEDGNPGSVSTTGPANVPEEHPTLLVTLKFVYIPPDKPNRMTVPLPLLSTVCDAATLFCK